MFDLSKISDVAQAVGLDLVNQLNREALRKGLLPNMKRLQDVLSSGLKKGRIRFAVQLAWDGDSNTATADPGIGFAGTVRAPSEDVTVFDAVKLGKLRALTPQESAQLGA